jgi:two-component system torCAD operon response regulator TorR
VNRSQQHIVVVDDDRVTREMLAVYFAGEGFFVSQAADAEELARVTERRPADLLLLDIRLPGKDGLTLTRELREKSEIGIILITSRSDKVDRILGLELGADDYVTKPFDERELLPRVRNLLRRVAAARRVQEQPVYRFEEWMLDLGRRELRSDKQGQVPLTTAEFDLLRTFVQNPGRPLTRDQLLGSRPDSRGEPFDRTVDTLIRRLRRKIEAEPDAPHLIVTVHGTGYVFTGGAS